MKITKCWVYSTQHFVIFTFMLQKSNFLNFLEHAVFIQTWKPAYLYFAYRECLLKTKRIQNESKKQIESENTWFSQCIFIVLSVFWKFTCGTHLGKHKHSSFNFNYIFQNVQTSVKFCHQLKVQGCFLACEISK